MRSGITHRKFKRACGADGRHQIGAALVVSGKERAARLQGDAVRVVGDRTGGWLVHGVPACGKRDRQIRAGARNGRRGPGFSVGNRHAVGVLGVCLGV